MSDSATPDAASVLDFGYPLAPMQEGMLFHSIDAPHDGVDVEQILCSLTETLDVESLVGAW